jgi:hypothetical protein
MYKKDLLKTTYHLQRCVKKNLAPYGRSEDILWNNNVVGKQHIKYVCLNGNNTYIHTFYSCGCFFVVVTRLGNCTRCEKDYSFK